MSPNPSSQQSQVPDPKVLTKCVKSKNTSISECEKGVPLVHLSKQIVRTIFTISSFGICPIPHLKLGSLYMTCMNYPSMFTCI